MKAVIALDKFKGTLTARAACETVESAVRALVPAAERVLAPLTDGGEDFACILTDAAGGILQRRTVTGPRGKPAAAALGKVPFANLRPAVQSLLAKGLPQEPQEVAVIDIASASGLLLLQAQERDPWQASTVGVGELLVELLYGPGAKQRLVLLGIGGSATNDLGLGALAALGLRALDTRGNVIENLCPHRFDKVERFDVAGLATPRAALRIACDVRNPLLGAQGASAVFGPQKGLLAQDVARMDSSLTKMADLLQSATSRTLDSDFPGAGAAGGIGYGLVTALGAELLPGAEIVHAWLGLDELLQAGNILLTGEGQLDSGSLGGKGPVALARQALQADCEVVFLAGRIADRIEPSAVAGCGISSDRLALVEVSPSGWQPPGRAGEASGFLAEAVTRVLRQKGWAHGT